MLLHKKIFFICIFFINILLMAVAQESVLPWEGDGSFDTPFLIKNARDLYELGRFENKKYLTGKYYFKQTEDINDLTKSLGLKTWIPLGRYIDKIYLDASFEGYYDGNNHAINGLVITNSDIGNQGLFYKINNSEINNVVIDCNIDAGNNDVVGALVSYASCASFTNIIVKGSIKGNRYIGGIVGICDKSYFKNINYEGKVSGTFDIGGFIGRSTENILETADIKSVVVGDKNVGGVFGEQNKTVASDININCKVSGNGDSTGGFSGIVINESMVKKINIKGKIIGKKMTGGFAGKIIGKRDKNASPDTFENIFSYADVNGERYCGGIVGSIENNSIVLKSKNNGKVYGNSVIGGIAGQISGNGREQTDVRISQCVNFGDVSGKESIGNSNIGGIVGAAMTRSNIVDCYNTGAISGRNRCGGILGGCISEGLTIKNCYSTGSVNTVKERNTDEILMGSIIGYFYGDTILNCFSTGDAALSINHEKVSSEKEVDGVGKNKYISKKAFVDYKFFNSVNDIVLDDSWNPEVWEIKDGSYPKLKF